MSRFRRADTLGATYFFTIVTYRRQPILCDPPVREALRHAINDVRNRWPFEVDAWVLMPDHLHCLWTLPADDADFSTRWSLIKRGVSMTCGERYRRTEWITDSKRKHRESTLWQRRYWEHQIRSESDLQRHVDYIHYNPVKHGLCNTPREWPWSTIHRHIEKGLLPADWGGEGSAMDGDFGE